MVSSLTSSIERMDMREAAVWKEERSDETADINEFRASLRAPPGDLNDRQPSPVSSLRTEVRQTAGWIGEESSIATPNSWREAIGDTVQSGPIIEGDLWDGGGVIVRGLFGKGGLAHKVAKVSDESSVSALVWRFWDWISAGWLMFERVR